MPAPPRFPAAGVGEGGGGGADRSTAPAVSREGRDRGGSQAGRGRGSSLPPAAFAAAARRGERGWGARLAPGSRNGEGKGWLRPGSTAPAAGARRSSSPGT